MSDIPLVQRNLRGLLYADGMHDALYRSAGRELLAAPDPPRPQPQSRSRVVSDTAVVAV